MPRAEGAYQPVLKTRRILSLLLLILKDRLPVAQVKVRVRALLALVYVVSSV